MTLLRGGHPPKISDKAKRVRKVTKRAGETKLR